MNIGKLLPLGFLIFLIGDPAVAQSDCKIEDLADVVATAWKNEVTVANVPCYDALLSSNAEAIEIHSRLLALLDEDYERIGYKAGFIGRADRERRGLDRPVFGVMYEGLMFDDEAVFDLSSIPRIQVEPDFLVGVGDTAINEARTLEELVPHLDRAYAFIELPSPLWEADYFGSGFMLQVMNGIPRYGVLGSSAAVGADFITDLANLQVYGYDGEGQELFHRDLSERPESPLEAVLEIVLRLRERGEALEPGDVISVGSLWEPNRSPQPGTTTHVKYRLGGETLEATVHLR